MTWRSVRVRAMADRDAVLAALFDAGSGGVQDEGESLVTHFPDETDLEVLSARIRAASPGAEVEVAEAPPVNLEAWAIGVRAHTIGSLTIAPPWLAPGGADARTIVIDPAMAFGTGEHATTRGVIALLPDVLRPGDRVADLGAGSAILSIAAVRLGAAWAAAIEMDPDAIGNAEENVARNGVADRVHVIEGDAALVLPLVRPVRVVLANIISSVLLELMPVIGEALTPDGAAILSGILATEREHMVRALEAEWRITAEVEAEEWWSVAIERR